MKRARQNKILDLISRYEIDKQEELLRYLRESGFDVTQATVSRDIRELGLVKVSGGNGRYRYVSVADAPSSAHVHGRFETIFPAFLDKMKLQPCGACGLCRQPDFCQMPFRHGQCRLRAV